MAKNDLDFNANNEIGDVPNYEEKSLCCFVIDTSTSMGESEHGVPIDELNKGLQHFHKEIKTSSITTDRLEVAVVTFNSTVEVVQPPLLTTQFDMPHLNITGSTQLVTGVRKGIELIQERKNWYKQTGQPYLRPWIILITDGAPDRGQDIAGLSQEIEVGTKNKDYVFLPIGVEGAHMDTLNQIAGYTKKPNGDWGKMEAMKLKGLNFFEFFKWVSASMSGIIGTDAGTTDLPNPNNWWESHVVE